MIEQNPCPEKEERRRETSIGTPAGTRRNMEEPANHDGTEPFSGGKKEERRETSTGTKKERRRETSTGTQPEPANHDGTEARS